MFFKIRDDQIFRSDVYSEVEFGPKNLGLSLEKTKENVMKAAQLTGIEEYLKENPYNLSYSMRKFVTMAAVIAALKNEGKTVITITHDMEFVVQNFDRVIVMAHKNVIADTDKREIFWNHAILEESMLKQPHISRWSHTLGLRKQVLNIEEFVEMML